MKQRWLVNNTLTGGTVRGSHRQAGSDANRPGPDDSLEAVSQVLRQVMGGVEKRNRRRRQRLPFNKVQRIAPYDALRLPSAEAMFREVRCHDISALGIAFYWPSRPDFEYLVLELGSPPEVTHITARVVRTVIVVGTQSEHLVGCRFLGRVRKCY